MVSKKNKEKYNIICFSNQLWDYPNWTNKRHVMHRLAKKGHKVLFVDPPVNLGRVFLRQLLRGFWPLSRLFTQTKVDKNGALIYTPINLLPFYKITSFFHILKIKLIAKKFFKEKRKTIIWTYHVQLAGLESYLDSISYDFLVYDCVDNYEGFPEEKAFFKTSVYGDDLRNQEKMLSERANIIFASAPGLVDKLKTYNSNIFYTPNVGDYKRFKNVKSYKYKIPNILKDIPRPRVGMLGTMDEYKFDSEIVRKAAIDNPDVSFVLGGPIALKDKAASIEDINLAGLDNVYYIGVTDYKEKKFFMAGFDAEMIPYQLNDYTVGGCFPVKFHDALAAGLPVVVTNLPAYAPFSDVAYISKNPQEFSDNIKKALKDDNDKLAKKRQLVAKENDWDGKVAKMLDLISSTIK